VVLAVERLVRLTAEGDVTADERRDAMRALHRLERVVPAYGAE
jgi:hypothetical protein